METTAQAKVELRHRMHTRLGTLTLPEVRQHSAAIWERLSVLPAFVEAACLP